MHPSTRIQDKRNELALINCMTDLATIAPDFMRGLTNIEPCLTVTSPGFDFLINERLPDDLVYRLAKALNETSERAWAAQDVFYSIRHAAETPTPLHPGAVRYYREQGFLK